jgi:hypothetical protein
VLSLRRRGFGIARRETDAGADDATAVMTLLRQRTWNA